MDVYTPGSRAGGGQAPAPPRFTAPRLVQYGLDPLLPVAARLHGHGRLPMGSLIWAMPVLHEGLRVAPLAWAQVPFTSKLSVVRESPEPATFMAALLEQLDITAPLVTVSVEFPETMMPPA